MLGYLRTLFRPSNLEERMEEEMRHHLEEHIEILIDEGMSPNAARKAALREFGNVEFLKEECRDSWGRRTFETFIRNLKFTFRQLAKQKGFSTVAILTLALCIGGNTAVFSIFNTLILRSLPFPDSEKIVEIYNSYPLNGLEKGGSNPIVYLDYTDNTTAFSQLAVETDYSANLKANGPPKRIKGNLVSYKFFDLFGITPEVGSFFQEEHMTKGQDTVVVLSHSYWTSKYASDPNAIGQTVKLNDISYKIIGVASREIEALYADSQIFLPISWDPTQFHTLARHSNWTRLYAKLKPNVSISQATVQLEARDQIYYQNSTPETRNFLKKSGHRTFIQNLKIERTKKIKPTLYLLQIGALFVLLIGCINITNLILIRANSRQTEFAIRRAMGGRPVDIGNQLLTESALLTLAGTSLGVLLGYGGIILINSYAMDLLPPMQPLTIDLGTLLFSLTLAVITSLAISVIPVTRILTSKLATSINQNNKATTLSKASNRISSTLVSGQIAITLILLIGAGLFIQSFNNIISQDLGFDPKNISTLRISVNGKNYRDNESVQRFKTQLLNTIKEIPEVESVSLSLFIPRTHNYPYTVFSIFGYQPKEEDNRLSANSTYISPGYFETLNIKILRGRDFNTDDVANKRNTIIIDKNLADRYFPDINPIGQRLGFVHPDAPIEDWPIVVGIAETVQHSPIDNIQGAPLIYRNLLTSQINYFSVFIKSNLDHNTVIHKAKERLKKLDPNLPIYMSGTLESHINNSLNNKRIITLTVTIFAGIALLLSVIGVYGVMAYNVSQKSREIGIRVALGAPRKQVLASLLKQGLVKTIIGLAIGLVGASLLSHFISSMLYEVDPLSLLIYATLTLLLFSAAMAASYFPARNITSIHPAESIRSE